jgi:hypothetical protein
LPEHADQAGVGVQHWLALVQSCPSAHVPQKPPQPSLPQVLPLHCGTQMQAPLPPGSQVRPAAQVPHDPPQPSPPHTRVALHWGTQTQVPVASQTW